MIPMTFSLVADDFGVKFVVKSVGKKHTENLITCINKEYFLSVDWTGELYCGVSLDWYYKNKHISLYMPGYVKSFMH